MAPQGIDGLDEVFAKLCNLCFADDPETGAAKVKEFKARHKLQGLGVLPLLGNVLATNKSKLATPEAKKLLQDSIMRKGIEQLKLMRERKQEAQTQLAEAATQKAAAAEARKAERAKASPQKQKEPASARKAVIKTIGASPAPKRATRTTSQSQGDSLVMSKSKLVEAILCRWWFAWPKEEPGVWPSRNWNVTEELQKRKLARYDVSDFNDAHPPEGWTKVYELGEFPGVFRDGGREADENAEARDNENENEDDDGQPKLYDLRPIDDRPCFATFQKKSKQELEELLSDCIAAQEKEEANLEDETLKFNSSIREKMDRLKRALQATKEASEDEFVRAF